MVMAAYLIYSPGAGMFHRCFEETNQKHDRGIVKSSYPNYASRSSILLILG